MRVRVLEDCENCLRKKDSLVHLNYKPDPSRNCSAYHKFVPVVCVDVRDLLRRFSEDKLFVKNPIESRDIKIAVLFQELKRELDARR